MKKLEGCSRATRRSTRLHGHSKSGKGREHTIKWRLMSKPMRVSREMLKKPAEISTSDRETTKGCETGIKRNIKKTLQK